MAKVAVVVKDPKQQYEALRTSLGTLLEDHEISMFVLDHEIEADEAYTENLELFEEMDGKYYSNHPSNIKKLNFTPADLDAVGEALREADLIVPFH
jgi:hypothetical protein